MLSNAGGSSPVDRLEEFEKIKNLGNHGMLTQGVVKDFVVRHQAVLGHG
jgi:hypothetical protein